MIVAMSRVRVMGLRAQLDAVISELQDAGVLHVAKPAVGGPLGAVALTPAQKRARNHLTSALADTEQALAALDLPPAAPGRTVRPARIGQLACWTRLAWQARRATGRLAARTAALEEERALIMKYQHFFSAFGALSESEARWPNASTYHVLVRPGDSGSLPALRASLREAIGDDFHLISQALPSGETAVLVVVSSQAAERVEHLLAQARVQEMPIPEAFGGGSLGAAIPGMRARLEAIPAELAGVEGQRTALRHDHGAELQQAWLAFMNHLQALDVLPLSAATARAFVLEGWVPAGTKRDLERDLGRRCGDQVVVAEVAREDWQADRAPVVLSNPRLLRPFETLVKLMPLPAYGSIDPTPFVAVFFPAFFGLMVGDIGYGIILAILGLVLHARSKPGTTLRNIAEIAGPCALFTMLAGVLYGELFGDLGQRWLGLRPLLFDREDAVVPFLLLAVALGVVHVLLGLVLGVINARHHPRKAAGRGVSAIMVVLAVLALLAAVQVLPQRFFTPAVIALLLAFPVLIALEGLVAMIELLGAVGNILSYTRIMALGVASVMLSVVANRMVGALGSVVVGVLFALLFHIVNFAIAMFSPTVHALRLHYVEFYGQFYSPGGVQYEPLTNRRRASGAPRTAPTSARHAA